MEELQTTVSSGMQELSSEQIDEVSGAGLASAIGYAVGYACQSSATFYGNLAEGMIV